MLQPFLARFPSTRFVLSLLAVSALSTFAHSTPAMASASSSKPDQIIAFEKARREAVVHVDLKALAAMSAQGLVYVDASGIKRNRAEYLDHIATEGVTYHSYSLDDLHAKVFGNLAVLTGIFRFDVEVKGRLNHGVQYFTSVYVHENKGWKLKIWHPTRATDIS
ncbi:nuclear transport factor 2 family protein [Sphingobium sp.]|uniref:nuclear transport factor 2 family protein n=1 Tax=Sphingobium sp. TaxID=1912891 RepID=UPI0028BE6A4D|nr:nuclear transport factor 2 family protein [Sphingobium sp.]